MLNALAGTEYHPWSDRDLMRRDGSPFSVAFGDPVLREDGLQNDTYGEAKRFFELSDLQLHKIVSYCHVGHSMTASRAARRVRAALDGPVYLRIVRAVLGWGKRNRCSAPTLSRQAQIMSRQGVDLDRPTLANWVGRAAFELRPVFDALMIDLRRSTKLFMDGQNPCPGARSWFP